MQTATVTKISSVPTETVYRTYDYGMFKKLEGNREVQDSRKKKIIKSINSVGYVMSPLIVNEKMEIVDGQGRFEALQELGLPIDYIIAPNSGIDECRAMNLNQTNWKISDYIKSYADMGNENYVRFMKLMDAYKEFGVVTIITALTGKSFVGASSEYIKSGNLICDERDYANAIDNLDFLRPYSPIGKQVKGRREFFYSALIFCHHHQDIDDSRLYKKISESYGRMGGMVSVETSLDEISKIYNERKRGDKVYLQTDYKRAMDEHLRELYKQSREKRKREMA